MVSESRNEGLDLERSPSPETAEDPFAAILKILEEEPFSVRFFQAMRLLERAAGSGAPVGHFSRPEDEAVRFKSLPSLGFPPSELYDLTRSPGGQWQMTVQFMGLTAALSALPAVYTEAVLLRMREKDHAMRDFFDIFNHRIISLFYRAWEKHRFFIGYEAGHDDLLSLRLFDLLGLGTEGMRNRGRLADGACMYYAGLLGRQVRSATSLRQILEDFFEVPIQINQFAGTWRALPPENRTCLLGTLSINEQLGFGVVAGDEVWDHHGRIQISIGPMRFERYQQFLPQESAYRELVGWMQFYADGAYETQVQLILEKQDVPACELGDPGARTPRLGLASWLTTKPRKTDADEATYLLPSL